jgi:hypothetical protein
MSREILTFVFETNWWCSHQLSVYGEVHIPQGYQALKFRKKFEEWNYLKLDYVLCNHIIPWNTALLEKLEVRHVAKKFSVFYRNRKFIIVFTRALQCSLSWCRWIHFEPSYSLPLRHILIMPSDIGSYLPNGLYSLVFPIKILYSISPFCAVCSVHVIRLDLISLQSFVQSGNYEVPHFEMFSFSCYFLPLPSASCSLT